MKPRIAVWKVYREGRDGLAYGHMGMVISTVDRLPPTITRYPWCDLARDVVAKGHTVKEALKALSETKKPDPLRHARVPLDRRGGRRTLCDDPITWDDLTFRDAKANPDQITCEMCNRLIRMKTPRQRLNAKLARNKETR